jgi:hypothetical protein
MAQSPLVQALREAYDIQRMFITAGSLYEVNCSGGRLFECMSLYVGVSSHYCIDDFQQVRGNILLNDYKI